MVVNPFDDCMEGRDVVGRKDVDDEDEDEDEVEDFERMERGQ